MFFVTATLSDTTLYYEVSGTGAPLLLLHGNGEDHTIFTELCAALSQDFTVYAIDSRGHGKSIPIKEFHYTDMAEDIVQFIRALGLDRPMVYGFSDGGIIALLLAIEHPESVSRVVVSGANARPSGLKRLPHLSFLFSYIKTRDPLTKLMLHEPKITAEMLRQIEAPTLVIAGSRDLIRPRHTKWIAASIPGAKLLILPGETHSSYVVNSTKLAPVLREYA